MTVLNFLLNQMFIKRQIVRDMTPFKFVYRNQSFGGAGSLHLQGCQRLFQPSPFISQLP